MSVQSFFYAAAAAEIGVLSLSSVKYYDLENHGSCYLPIVEVRSILYGVDYMCNNNYIYHEVVKRFQGRFWCETKSRAEFKGPSTIFIVVGPNSHDFLVGGSRIKIFSKNSHILHAWTSVNSLVGVCLSFLLKVHDKIFVIRYTIFIFLIIAVASISFQFFLYACFL